MTPETVHVDLEVPEALYQRVIEKVEARGGFQLLVERFLTNLLVDAEPVHSTDPKLCEHPDVFETRDGSRRCAWCRSALT